jgi:uncharacterized protein YjaZ
MIIHDLLLDRSLWGNESIFKPVLGLKMGRSVLPDSYPGPKLFNCFDVDSKLNWNNESSTVAKAALEEARSVSRKYFSNSPTHVYICGSAGKLGLKEFGGVSGYSWPSAVLIYFDKDSNWRKHILATAIHEFNHVARFNFSNPYETFQDWLIFEGLAEVFLHEYFKKTYNSPWTSQLAPEDMQPFLNKIRFFLAQ